MDDNSLHQEPQPEESKATPVMDIVPPAPTPNDNKSEAKMSHPSLAPEKPKHLSPETRPPKSVVASSSNGSTAAVIATVIVILALALMATYAYIKTK